MGHPRSLPEISNHWIGTLAWWKLYYFPEDSTYPFSKIDYSSRYITLVPTPRTSVYVDAGTDRGSSWSLVHPCNPEGFGKEYVLVEIYEVDHFPQTSDPTDWEYIRTKKPNLSTTIYFGESELPKFFQTVTDFTQGIDDFQLVNSNTMLLEYRKKDNAVPFDKVGNVFLVTFTSCYARLRIYHIMEPLNTRILYHDTDSNIYIHDPRRFILGDYLRYPTNKCKGGRIMEYVSGCPKNYSYRTQSGKTVVKVRGFRIPVNYDTSQKRNFATMKK